MIKNIFIVQNLKIMCESYTHYDVKVNIISEKNIKTLFGILNK